ncbi:MAG: threonine/serine exporter family protein [Bacillaceae bacterium]|nr:threonine/serine exporter family protein [Bacillaceae bacterium]
MVLELFICFIATASYGIIFSAPKKSLILGGFIGMIAWIVYRTLPSYGVTTVFATSIASVITASISHYLARKLRFPATVFSIPGIIPLVPGSKAYYTMIAFLEGDYIGGLELGIDTMLQAGAIAAGLVFALVVFSYGRGIGYRNETNRSPFYKKT